MLKLWLTAERMPGGSLRGIDRPLNCSSIYVTATSPVFYFAPS